jgi:hypothetical protein
MVLKSYYSLKKILLCRRRSNSKNFSHWIAMIFHASEESVKSTGLDSRSNPMTFPQTLLALYFYDPLPQLSPDQLHSSTIAQQKCEEVKDTVYDHMLCL